MMKNNLVALIAGIIFGIGLAHSQMVNPAVVIAFLDVTGQWDPRLVFVMVGALVVSVISYRVILKQARPVCADKFFLPTSKDIDRPLVLGAVLFGIGWGLAGICPGPAITGLAFGMKKFFVFAGAMLVGMGVYQLLNRS